VGHEARWEYLRVVYERYRKAEGKAKGGLLDEFCLNTGCWASARGRSTGGCRGRRASANGASTGAPSRARC
jgi:hypothetical protein